MQKITDLTGQKFGRLTVIDLAHTYEMGRAKWNCVCECGGKSTPLGHALRHGRTKSCGCLAKEMSRIRRLTHGMEKTRQYKIWVGMRNRCRNPKTSYYHIYGGKGITVCKEWESFEKFWEDMKEGYSDELSIDRVDSNGNYCKENCRWATPKEQGKNKNNNLIHNGECASEASRRLGGFEGLVAGRIRNGWEIEDAFNTPPKGHRHEQALSRRGIPLVDKDNSNNT